MKIRPLHDRVIVKRTEEETTSPGGIVIPDSAAEKPSKGEVVAVGNGKLLDNGERLNPAVKAGDKVLFGKYSGTEVKVDGTEYLVMREDDVMAVVDVSYQARFPRGLSPTTLLAADPAVFQVAPMIVYAPMGRGAWSRPQLRLVWRIAKLNDAALDAYAIDDPRRAHSTVHFLGVQAEWWFNSSTR